VFVLRWLRSHGCVEMVVLRLLYILEMVEKRCQRCGLKKHQGCCGLKNLVVNY
jgi:hypothetical protein